MTSPGDGGGQLLGVDARGGTTPLGAARAPIWTAGDVALVPGPTALFWTTHTALLENAGGEWTATFDPGALRRALLSRRQGQE